LISFNQVYDSSLVFLKTIAPTGVEVRPGEDYGVRLDDPAGKSPSLSPKIDLTSPIDLEIGSDSTRHLISVFIHAKSRLQRNDLMTVVYSGLKTRQFPIYSSIDDTDLTPVGAPITLARIAYEELQSYSITDFDTDRETFFWTAVVSAPIELFDS
jgi:hypothetical protein